MYQYHGESCKLALAADTMWHHVPCRSRGHGWRRYQMVKTPALLQICKHSETTVLTKHISTTHYCIS